MKPQKKTHHHPTVKHSIYFPTPNKTKCMISRENVKKPRTAYFLSALYFPSLFLKKLIHKQAKLSKL